MFTHACRQGLVRLNVGDTVGVTIENDRIVIFASSSHSVGSPEGEVLPVPNNHSMLSSSQPVPSHRFEPYAATSSHSVGSPVPSDETWSMLSSPKLPNAEWL